jgi:hypothetical protein
LKEKRKRSTGLSGAVATVPCCAGFDGGTDRDKVSPIAAITINVIIKSLINSRLQGYQ